MSLKYQDRVWLRRQIKAATNYFRAAVEGFPCDEVQTYGDVTRLVCTVEFRPLPEMPKIIIPAPPPPPPKIIPSTDIDGRL
jgi:hypothetical protein